MSELLYIMSPTILQDNQGTDPMIDITEESKIFGCRTNPKKNTKWHEAINREANELAIKDPILVTENGN